ncbi:MAG: MCE family protein [Nocardioides sp.]|nr:MCE family protein [Nocardioides sp.]
MGALLRRVIPLLVIAALVAAAALTVFGSDDRKELTAHFPRTVAVYEGSEVRVLGVAVGTVDSVTPSGTDVIVSMHYDGAVDVPADASAVIVAPSVIGDRFVQLTPVFTGGEILADGAVLEEDRTAVPLELDEVFTSLDRLTVALGPTGANRNGALSDLLETTAANFGGQGANFHTTVENFSKLSETLDDNKEELFGSAAELEKFVKTLADNDQTVRDFNQSLAAVSTMLAGERQELAASLENLSVGLGKVASFVKENRTALSRNISGLNRVTKVLVKQRGALDEVLSTAPLALSNLSLTYNPQAGTLDTNANLGELVNQIESDPSTLLCGAVSATDPKGTVCDAIKTILPRTGTFAAAGAGTGTSMNVASDPTLGGLVPVTP